MNDKIKRQIIAEKLNSVFRIIFLSDKKEIQDFENIKNKNFPSDYADLLIAK